MEGTRIIKPQRLGVMHRTYKVANRNHLCLTGLALFDFDKPSELHTDQALWSIVAEQLGSDGYLDMAMPKLRGEVLVAGKAMAPGGQPVPALDVGLSIGPITKIVRVFGDRYWHRMQDWSQVMISDPIPFAEMPLNDTRAFGGPDYKYNPVGTGYGAASIVAAGHAAPLANFEDPAHPMTAVDQRGYPVGLGPIDFALPQRQGKAGTYDQAWLDNDFPGMARDVDWSMFNAASPDQQIEGYFSGDEPFTVQGFHPDRPSDGGRLPGLRIRGFVRQKKPEGPAFFELPMHLDTVWLFPSIRMGVVAWRGLTDVADNNGLDVTDVLLAAEALHAPPRTVDHYKAVKDRRSNPEEAAFDFFNDDPLMPIQSPEEIAARLEEQQRLRAERRDERESKTRRLLESALTVGAIEDPDAAPIAITADQSAELDAMVRQALEPNEYSDLLDEMPVVTEEMIQAGRVDMAGIMDISRKIGDLAQKKADTMKAMAEQDKAQNAEEMAARPQSVIDAEQEALKTKLEQAVLGETGSGSFDIDQFLGDVLDEVPPQTTDRAVADAGQQMADGLYEARRASPEPVGPMEPLTPMLSDFLGALARRAMDEGRALTGRDLAGANLRAIDLHNRDLRKTLLETANLDGAVFTGAKADGIVLAGASLHRASLAGASLIGANLATVDAETADFSGTDLTRAGIMKANFGSARFQDAFIAECQAYETIFTRSRNSGMHCERGVFINADFTEAVLDGVEFVETILMTSIFRNASIRNARFKNCIFIDPVMDGADLEGTTFDTCGLIGDKASFRGTRFTASNILNSTLRGNDLSGLDFSLSKIEQSDLYGSNLAGANLERVSLAGTIAQKANFEGARLTRSNLLQTMLSEAKLGGTDLRASVLYGTELTDAQFARTDLREAFIAKTRMPRPS